MRDMEFELKRVVKEYEVEVGDMKQKSERDGKEQDKLLRIIDEKEKLNADHAQAEKKFKLEIKKADKEKSKLTKKVNEYKSYIKKVEDNII